MSAPSFALLSLVALLGCGTQGSPARTPSGETRFPHAENYRAGAAHGAEALADPASCNGCHREGATAPSCASCHEGYPHPDGFLAGAVHGAGLGGEAADTARAPCETCHGISGLQAPSCTSCHGSYPHPEGWEGAGSHGAWALSRGSAVAACGSCHGAALEGTAVAPSCVSCHADYPHPAGFAERAAHGAADLSSCASCHGEGGTGGVAGVACSRCHATYPHPADQRSAHLAVVTQVGERVCLSCHEAGDGRITIPASCGATCHGSTP